MKLWRRGSLSAQVHYVWFATFFGVGVLGGLWLGRWMSLSVWLLGLVIGAGMILRRRQRWMLVPMLLLGVIPGVIWGQVAQRDTNRYQEYFGSNVVVSGVVADDAEYGDRGEQRFSITRVMIYGQSYPGQISVSTYSFHDIARGDSVTLQGKMRPGFGSKQAAMSFVTVSEWRENHDAINMLRNWFAAEVRSGVAEPMASLGLGFVVGQRSALPEDLDDTLRAVGLTHIVVASGYNLTILVRLARRLFEKVSAYLSLVTASGLMLGFIALSGASPSLVRAGVVCSLSLLAWWYGRFFHPVVLLVVAMMITAVWWPPFLWDDLGWWLSFLAFYGVLVLAPIIKKWLNITGTITSIMVETISATIMTLPIIIVVFSTVAPLALPANVLIVPLVPLAMILTVVAGVMGALLPSLAGFFGAPAQLLLEMMVRESEWVASLMPQWTVTMPAWLMVVTYAIIIAVSLTLYQRMKVRENLVT